MLWFESCYSGETVLIALVFVHIVNREFFREISGISPYQMRRRLIAAKLAVFRQKLHGVTVALTRHNPNIDTELAGSAENTAGRSEEGASDHAPAWMRLSL